MNVPGIGVVGTNGDDLVVRLALIDQLQGTQHLDGNHRAHLNWGGADLHHIQRVVVAAVAEGVLDHGVLPGLGQQAVVEEWGAVVVVPGLALALILHDGVVVVLLADLHLGGCVHGDLHHKVEQPLSLVSVQGDVMPRRDLGPRGALEVQLVLGGAVLAIRLHVGSHGRVHNGLGPGHPLVRVHVLVVVADDLPARGHHEPRGHAVSLQQVVGDLVGAGRGALPGQRAHLGARDGDEVVHAALVAHLHLVVRHVVVHLGEAQQVEVLAQAGGHLQHVPAVVAVVQVVVRVGQGQLRALHARGVAAHHEVGRAAVAPALGVEDHLRGARVHHGRGPDGHHRPGRVQHALLQHRHVLLHAHIQGHIVLLGPAAQRGQPEHRVLVPLAQQPVAALLHQVGVARVRGVPRLEGVHDVRVLLGELRAQLLQRQAVLVQAIVVADALK
mmetsp:Transcript_25990/g.40891  ORF Transcript_25990/g.40891 Transcript_25990/m.40891 type:complete len:442 (-) Transcript_25990:191-1516(-)